MKKILLSLLLASAMVFGMTACGSNQPAETPNTPSNSEANPGTASEETVTLKWAIWDEATTQYWGDLKAAYDK